MTRALITHRLIPTGVAIVALAAVVLVVPDGTDAAEAAPVARSTPAESAEPAAPTGQPGEETNFVSACRFSHRAPDDPIVHPAKPGASHDHTFFANTTTNAYSTYDSLRAGDTTCRRTGDTAAYWVPTMIEGGQVQPASHVLSYYVTGGKDASTIKPFPAGLRVVTDATQRTFRFSCVGRAGERMRDSLTPPDCPANTHLVLRVFFPDCWDGANVDSADHRMHLAYNNRRGACPTTHPVPVPRLRLNVHYPRSNGGGDVAFTSGGPETAHADFFNAWDQAVLTDLVTRCLNAQQHCGQRGPSA